MAKAKAPKAKRVVRAVKITPKKAQAIFNHVTKKGWTQRRTGKKFGVSRSAVYDIVHGRTSVSVGLC